MTCWWRRTGGEARPACRLLAGLASNGGQCLCAAIKTNLAEFADHCLT
jgi:hypothetical protein